jgi:hypothetical protein
LKVDRFLCCIHDLEIIAKAGSLEELANRVQFLPL